MRQLKFRQPIYHWDGSFREWAYWGLFEIDGEWVNVTPASRHYIADVKITDPLDSTQFTGLTDKNGVEIYEGDIIDYGNGRHYPITYENNGFGIKFHNGHERCWLDLTKFAVIGNVFEHPNLINQTA